MYKATTYVPRYLRATEIHKFSSSSTALKDYSQLYQHSSPSTQARALQASVEGQPAIRTLLAPTPRTRPTMPPIPIHKDDPIAPTKADGITPQTAANNPPPPTRTTPAYAPATTTQDSSNPPPPQPGARPAAPTASTAQSDYTASPAPPQPGPTATVVTTETRLGGPPPQFTNPPPSDSALAGRSTTTLTTASKPGPTTLNYGPAASPYQAADSAAAAPTRTSLEHPPGYAQAPDNAPFTAGGGIGGSGGLGGQGQGSEEGGVGAAAWNVLSKAGEALKKGEEAAWKALRNK